MTPEPQQLQSQIDTLNKGILDYQDLVRYQREIIASQQITIIKVNTMLSQLTQAQPEQAQPQETPAAEYSA